MSLPPVAARRSGGGRNPEMWGCGTPGHRAYLLTTRTHVRIMFLCPNNQIATGPFHARGLSRAPKLGGNPSFPRRREPTPRTCAVGARLSQFRCGTVVFLPHHCGTCVENPLRGSEPPAMRHHKMQQSPTLSAEITGPRLRRRSLGAEPRPPFRPAWAGVPLCPISVRSSARLGQFGYQDRPIRDHHPATE